MGIDRGALSKIDRKLLSGLAVDEDWRMVRVPVSEAEWSTWKRYCSMVDISMGRALSELMRRELGSLVAQVGQLDRLAGVEADLNEREARLDEREREVAEREHSVRDRERFASRPGRLRSQADISKVGRNDLCPCRSGLKYKRCHGAPC